MPLNYHLISTNSQLMELAARLEKCPVFSYDTETTGLYWHKTKVFLFAICDGMQTWVIRVKPDLQLKKFHESIFRDSSKSVVMHNAKFDVHQALSTFGVMCDRQWIDTKVMSHLIDEHKPNGLKALMKTELGIEPLDDMKIQEWFRKHNIKKKGKDYSKLPEEWMPSYVATDAFTTYKLYEKFNPTIQHYFKVLFETEMKVLRILFKMERNGLPIDKVYLQRLEEEYKERIEGRKKKLIRLAGRELNLNSSQQLGDLLFNKFELPQKKINKKSNQPSTDISVLKELAHPFTKELITYRKDQKILSTYISGLIPWIHKGHIHPTYSIVKDYKKEIPSDQDKGSKTRFSSRDPNAQNIANYSDVQRAFITDGNDEMNFWDLSQIEMRGFAHYSQDPKLIHAFRQGKDIYAATAESVLGHTPSAFERQVFKAVNLSLIFCVGKRKLADFFKLRGIEISREEAADFRGQYLNTFSRVPAFQKSVQQTAKASRTPWGHFVRNSFGRVSRINPLWKEVELDGKIQWRDMSYVAVNRLVQTWARDLMAQAMVRIEEKFQPKWRNQIHDAVWIDHNLKGKARMEFQQEVSHCLTYWPEFTVPVTVHMKSSETNWAEVEAV